MNEERALRLAERWFGLLLRLYPQDFREELGDALVETYRDRARAALRDGGVAALARVCIEAFADSARNGPGERARPAVRWRRSGNWGRDAELALRRLVRAPLFAATMVATLTVGLGAFAVVYAVVHQVLLEPLPYDRAGDLYYVWRDYRAIFDLDRGWLGGTDIAELDAAGGVIEGAVGLLQQNRTLSGVDGTDPSQVTLIRTSPELFDLLGVRPMLGRVFTPEEVGPSVPPVIVLTYDLWNRLGAERGIIGRDIRLDGQPYTVIGVMPRDFSFVRHSSLGPPTRADAYIPLNHHLAETNPGNGSYAGLMRVRPGTPPEAVTAAVTAVARRIDERDFGGRGVKLYPVQMKEDLIAGVRPALVVLGAAGVFLVLVLMVNLATLLLVRGMQREQEFAVSRALGANEVAIVRATLLEGALLGTLGGAGGALLAVWGTRALVGLAPVDLPRRESIAVDWQVALVVVGIGALLGFVAATAPAFWAARTHLSVLLNTASVRGGGGRQRLRRSMVVVQVALSLVLLTAGGLVVRSFERLLRADPGFDPAGVLTLRIPVPTARYDNDTLVNALHARIEAGLAALPGVTSVGAAGALPLLADADQMAIGIPGAPGNTGDPEHDRPLVDYIAARPGYFETLGFRLVEGRTFTGAAPSGLYEVVIDRTLADHFFPTGSAIGAIIPVDADTLRVIGVVEQARLYDVHADGRPQVYLRGDQVTYPTMYFALRTQREPLDLVPEARAVVRAIDPQLALADVRTLDEVVGESLRQQRISAVLISGFSLGALLLAAMGLFGIVAGSVARRRHELAVRLALGADQGRVVRMVMSEGAALIALGVLVGIPGIFMAASLVRGVLVGISPFDPLTIAAVAAGLGAIALLACYIPARRVSRIEPAASLRQER